MFRPRSCGYVLLILTALVCLNANIIGQSKPKGEIDLVGYAHTDLSWLWRFYSSLIPRHSSPVTCRFLKTFCR